MAKVLTGHCVRVLYAYSSRTDYSVLSTQCTALALARLGVPPLPLTRVVFLHYCVRPYKLVYTESLEIKAHVSSDKPRSCRVVSSRVSSNRLPARGTKQGRSGGGVRGVTGTSTGSTGAVTSRDLGRLDGLGHVIVHLLERVVGADRRVGGRRLRAVGLVRLGLGLGLGSGLGCGCGRRLSGEW